MLRPGVVPQILCPQQSVLAIRLSRLHNKTGKKLVIKLKTVSREVHGLNTFYW